MPRYIIKIQDRFFEWSTVVDAPVTYGMTQAELREHVKEEYGNDGLRELAARLARVEIKGTSSHHHASLAELLECNRAGDDEQHLTEQEIYDRYANPPNDLFQALESAALDTRRLDWLEKYGATPICSRTAIDAAMREQNDPR